MKKIRNEVWKNEMEELLPERLGQIYKRIIKEEEVKRLKQNENKIEEKLENLLKEKTKSGFNIYCEYEEIRSEYINKLLNTYYREGVKDGIRFIIENIK